MHTAPPASHATANNIRPPQAHLTTRQRLELGFWDTIIPALTQLRLHSAVPHRLRQINQHLWIQITVWGLIGLVCGTLLGILANSHLIG